MRSASSSRFNSRLAQVNLIRRRLCISLVNCADAWQRSTENIKIENFPPEARLNVRRDGGPNFGAPNKNSDKKYGQEIRPKYSTNKNSANKNSTKHCRQEMPPRNSANEIRPTIISQTTRPRKSAKHFPWALGSWSLGPRSLGPWSLGLGTLGPWALGPNQPTPFKMI